MEANLTLPRPAAVAQWQNTRLVISGSGVRVREIIIFKKLCLAYPILGAATLSITAFSKLIFNIMIFSIMIFSIITFSIMIFSIMIFSTMIFSVMTFSIKIFSIITFSIMIFSITVNESLHSALWQIVRMPNVIMLSVVASKTGIN
jgi:hypothetical protein